MRFSGRSVVGALMLLVAGVVAAKAPTRAAGIPVELAEVKGVRLGESTAKFMADFATDEKEATAKGLRIFDVRQNTLPSGVASMRCEFLDGKLVYVQAQLDQKLSGGSTWTTFIAPTVARHGVPQPLAALLGVARLHGARLGENVSAGWTDRKAALVYGRQKRDPAADPSAAPVYFVALLDRIFVARAAESLKGEEAAEVAAETAAKAAASQKRTADEADAKRTQEAKEAETQRVLADKDAEAKRLREEADKARREGQDEAQRLRAEADGAKLELQNLKDTAERDRARKAAEEERARVLREATGKVMATQSAAACACVEGRRILIRCHVRSDAEVPVLATVAASGTAHINYHDLLKGNRDFTSTTASRQISLQPRTEMDTEIVAEVPDADENCTDAMTCTCVVSNVAVQ